MNRLAEYCNKMNMSYSYKPVLIKALMEHGGQIHIDDAVNYFVAYYGKRLSMGLIAEMPNSIYSNLNCTVEDIASNIKGNPVKALLNSDFFEYDSKNKLFGIIPNVWNTLTAFDRQEIMSACDRRLDEYYERIVKRLYQDIICFDKPNEEYGYLSNSYLSNFVVRGETFSSVDQYMMYHKALQFNDCIARDKIMQIKDVGMIKAIGREINGSNIIWNGKKQLIAYQGLLSKFSQVDELKEQLINTGASVLALCSVDETFWGTGIPVYDNRRFTMNEWQGQNVLGFSLMHVRNVLHETRSL